MIIVKLQGKIYYYFLMFRTPYITLVTQPVTSSITGENSSQFLESAPPPSASSSSSLSSGLAKQNSEPQYSVVAILNCKPYDNDPDVLLWLTKWSTGMFYQSW